MGIVSLRERDAIGRHDDEGAPLERWRHWPRPGPVAKCANKLGVMPNLREPGARAERVPGARPLRQENSTRIAGTAAISRRSAQMRQAQPHRRNGRRGHEVALAAMRATQVLVPLDAAHEGMD